MASSETRSKLRIALILEPAFAGVGRHVLDLAKGLAERDHDVTVVYSPVRAEPDFVQQVSKIAGLRVTPFPMRRSVGLHDLTALRGLSALLTKLGPFDILHANSSKAGALVRLMPRSIPGGRIYTPHALRTMDPEIKSLPRLVYGTVERWLAPRADAIITVGSAELRHAEKVGLGPGHLKLIVNGADPSFPKTREEARAEMELKPDEVAVGLIGRLANQKDPLRFVAAINAAHEESSSVRGIVVGEGELRAEAEAMASPGTTRFLGWRDGPSLMPGLDLYVLASRYEAMPYTLLEAIHAGLPIVATEVGGVAETVCDGKTGVILPVDASAKALGRQIAILAEDSQKRAAAGAAARALAAERTVSHMVEQTLSVYREIVAARAECAAA